MEKRINTHIQRPSTNSKNTNETIKSTSENEDSSLGLQQQPALQKLIATNPSELLDEIKNSLGVNPATVLVLKEVQLHQKINNAALVVGDHAERVTHLNLMLQLIETQLESQEDNSMGFSSPKRGSSDSSMGFGTSTSGSSNSSMGFGSPTSMSSNRSVLKNQTNPNEFSPISEFSDNDIDFNHASLGTDYKDQYKQQLINLYSNTTPADKEVTEKNITSFLNQLKLLEEKQNDNVSRAVVNIRKDILEGTFPTEAIKLNTHATFIHLKKVYTELSALSIKEANSIFKVAIVPQRGSGVVGSSSSIDSGIKKSKKEAILNIVDYKNKMAPHGSIHKTLDLKNLSNQAMQIVYRQIITPYVRINMGADATRVLNEAQNYSTPGTPFMNKDIGIFPNYATHTIEIVLPLNSDTDNPHVQFDQVFGLENHFKSSSSLQDKLATYTNNGLALGDIRAIESNDRQAYASDELAYLVGMKLNNLTANKRPLEPQHLQIANAIIQCGDSKIPTENELHESIQKTFTATSREFDYGNDVPLEVLKANVNLIRNEPNKVPVLSGATARYDNEIINHFTKNKPSEKENIQNIILRQALKVKNQYILLYICDIFNEPLKEGASLDATVYKLHNILNNAQVFPNGNSRISRAIVYAYILKQNITPTAISTGSPLFEALYVSSGAIDSPGDLNIMASLFTDLFRRNNDLAVDSKNELQKKYIENTGTLEQLFKQATNSLNLLDTHDLRKNLE